MGLSSAAAVQTTESVPACAALQDAAPALLLSLPLAFLLFLFVTRPCGADRKLGFFTSLNASLRLDFRDTFCPPLAGRCCSLDPLHPRPRLGLGFAPMQRGLCSSCPLLGTPSHQWGH